MGNFDRDRRSGGGRDFKRREFGDRGSDRPQMMHKTICSNCGKECEVPFKPNGSKPVFCRDCFQNNRSSESTGSDNSYPRRSNFEDRGSSQVNRPVPQAQPQYKEQFDALNMKLDKILSMLSFNETVKESQATEVNQIPEVEIPIIKKKKKAPKK